MNYTIDFQKSGGLIPVIIQESTSKNVLMLGYMNKQAYDESLKSGYVYFWSRSRNELWLKGKKSGNKLKIVRIDADCDNDTLLIQVDYKGNTICHLEKWSCFENGLWEQN